MNMGLINKLMSVLEASLSKLSRYDEGSFIGSILSFTVWSLLYCSNKCDTFSTNLVLISVPICCYDLELGFFCLSTRICIASTPLFRMIARSLRNNNYLVCSLFRMCPVRERILAKAMWILLEIIWIKSVAKSMMNCGYWISSSNGIHSKSICCAIGFRSV